MPDFQDDPRIPDHADVWRRITPEWLKWDREQGRQQLNSQAFQDSVDETPMSVFLASELPAPEEALAGHSGYFLAGLNVGFVRSLGLGVAREPIRPEDPVGHAWVVGTKTRRIRRQLAKHAHWVIGP